MEEFVGKRKHGSVGQSSPVPRLCPTLRSSGAGVPSLIAEEQDLNVTDLPVGSFLSSSSLSKLLSSSFVFAFVNVSEP